jgi:membrane fusion protein (multidrug efflux system)
LGRAFLLWGVPALIAVLGIGFYGQGGTVASTDNAYVKQDRIDVSARIAGDVVEVPVHENERVEQGAVVLRLDPGKLVAVERHAAAELANARLSVETVRAEYRAKHGEVTLARETAQYANREYQRRRELAARQLVTQTALDEAHQAADIANGRIAVLELELAEARARLGGDPDALVDRHPAVLAAAAELAQARTDLGYTEIRAPRPGIVSRLPQVGDHVREGLPAFAIVADATLWVEANFKETDLGWVRPGQRVHVAVDLYPGHEWRGVVDSVAQATGAEFALLPAQNASGNWVKVVQRIPVRIALETNEADPPLRSGASAEVSIDTGSPTRLERWLARF